MPGVQTDVYSAFSQYLAKSIVAAYDRRKAHNPDLEDAIALMRGWNGQMDKDQAAPLKSGAQVKKHWSPSPGASNSSACASCWLPPGDGFRLACCCCACWPTASTRPRIKARRK
jgi:hypothetical protein